MQGWEFSHGFFEPIAWSFYWKSERAKERFAHEKRANHSFVKINGSKSLTVALLYEQFGAKEQQRANSQPCHFASFNISKNPTQDLRGRYNVDFIFCDRVHWSKNSVYSTTIGPFHRWIFSSCFLIGLISNPFILSH